MANFGHQNGQFFSFLSIHSNSFVLPISLPSALNVNTIIFLCLPPSRMKGVVRLRIRLFLTFGVRRSLPSPEVDFPWTTDFFILNPLSFGQRPIPISSSQAVFKLISQTPSFSMPWPLANPCMILGGIEFHGCLHVWTEP